jgi:hypothetical protein
VGVALEVDDEVVELMVELELKTDDEVIIGLVVEL